MKFYIIFFTSFVLFCNYKEAFTKSLASNPLVISDLNDSKKIKELQKRIFVDHKDLEGLTSYAGFINIDKITDANTFFWYFPSRSNSTTDPLILSLTGGPGVPSLLQIFNGNGPFHLSKNLTLKIREESIIKNNNVLYIDNPMGTGFSFTKSDAGYVHTQSEVGRDVVKFLTKFFKLFPDKQQNDFYVLGISYGGRFAVSVANAIKQYNGIGTGTKINLKGLLLGSPFIDFAAQHVHARFLKSIGLVDYDGFLQILKEETITKKLFLSNKTNKYVELSQRFMMVNNLIMNLTGLQSVNNYVSDHPDDYSYIEYLEKSGLQKVLHVNKYKPENLYFVFNKFIEDAAKPVTSVLKMLLEHYRVLIFNGQFDVVSPYSSTEKLLRNLISTVNKEHKKINRKQWIVNGKLVGYSRTVGNLVEIFFRNAGHVVLEDQSDLATKMIYSFTRSEEF